MLEDTLRVLSDQISSPQRLETLFRLYDSRLSEYENALTNATKQIVSEVLNIRFLLFYYKEISKN